MIRKHYLKKSIRKAEQNLERLGQRSRRMSWWRLSIVLMGLALGVSALYFRSDALSYLTLFVFIFIFPSSARMQHKIKQTLAKFEIWKQIKADQLHRLSLNWDVLPKPVILLPAEHPFAKDLDILGVFSLHRLLDNTISRQGSKLLLKWLSSVPDSVDTVLERQKSVEEIIPLYHFRNKLALISGNTILDADRLLSWLKARQNKIPAFILPVLGLLAFLNILLLGLYLFVSFPAYWIYSLTVYIGLFFLFIRHIQQLFSETMHLESTLKSTTSVLHYLERFQPGHKSRLKKILNPIQDKKTRPARFLRQLNSLMILVGFRQNPVIGVIVNLILPVDYILMQILQSFKHRLADRFPLWLDALHELDALSALANFAWLHPNNTFPELHSKDITLSVREMGHPLIPGQERIRNDFSLNEQNKLALITGSNMSGKSTFLRTIGSNLALAFAGSAVCASHFSTSLFRLNSCIRVNDALDQGLSYFYAEVKRLKMILDAIKKSEDIPVLYLVDEIFKGTNNRERLIGSRAYILNLLKCNSLGLVSSHDLELTALAEQAPTLKNFHFEEQIRDGKMAFDYKIKSGPSPSTNALKIMELEGLPVETMNDK